MVGATGIESILAAGRSLKTKHACKLLHIRFLLTLSMTYGDGLQTLFASDTRRLSNL